MIYTSALLYFLPSLARRRSEPWKVPEHLEEEAEAGRLGVVVSRGLRGSPPMGLEGAPADPRPGPSPAPRRLTVHLEVHCFRLFGAHIVVGLALVLPTHPPGHLGQSERGRLLPHQQDPVPEPGHLLVPWVAADNLARHGHRLSLCHSGFSGTDLDLQLRRVWRSGGNSEGGDGDSQRV